LVLRTRFADADCPVARSIDIIGDWWSLMIVRDALDGARRFSDFQKRLGISKGILAARLRTLVAHGVLETDLARDGGAQRQYTLTQRGLDLFPVIVALRQWGEAYCFSPDEAYSVLVETRSGESVARLQVRSAMGQPLVASDTVIKKVSRAETTSGRARTGASTREAARRTRQTI
jgi:DNA-binding HxlR family transcriptional regulator